MPTLLAGTRGPADAITWIEAADTPPAVKAALWLYVDDLDRAHVIVQDLDTPTGSYLHAILHRREGDFSNSKYWFRRAGDHPAIAAIPGYDPCDFVDRVQAAGTSSPEELIVLQRAEWKAVLDYAVAEGA